MPEPARQRTLERPIRVCHLGKYYPPAIGGIETHVRTIAQAQANKGIDVTVLCVNHDVGKETSGLRTRLGRTRTLTIADGGVQVIRVGRTASVARLDVCPRLPRTIRSLNRLTFDVLHLHTPNPTMLLALAAMTGHGTPLVITHHSDIVRQSMLRTALDPFERRIYLRSSAVLASTDHYARASMVLARHPEKLDVVPLGLDLGRFLNPSPRTLQFESQLRTSLDDQPLWLAVGRLVYYKGFETAIAALPHVAGRLMIVGDGPLQSSLQHLARQLNVADRIIWRGRTSDDELAGAYRAATALWFPSKARSEAFGLVQIEAMASRCPVINADIPASGVSWVSLDGQTGLTVPVDDARALATASQRLIDEPALRHQFAEAARQRAIEQFDHQTMADRSIAVYRRVIDRRTDSFKRPDGLRLRTWVRNFNRLADDVPSRSV